MPNEHPGYVMPYNQILSKCEESYLSQYVPENLYVSRDKVEGNIEIRGKKNSLFPKWVKLVENK